MIGMGIPRAQSRMPRMSNLVGCNGFDFVAPRGGTMAEGITIGWLHRCMRTPARNDGPGVW